MPKGPFFNFNGDLSQSSTSLESLSNRAFKYGDGLFESVLVVNGAGMNLQAHLNRLCNGMRFFSYDFDEMKWKSLLTEAMNDLIAQSPTLPYSRLRLHVYRSGGGAFRPQDNRPDFLIELRHLPQNPQALASPLRIGICDAHPIYPAAWRRFKTGNALPYILAAQCAAQNGWDDALLVNHCGNLVEGTSSNLFLIRGNQALTPPLADGCLEGTMRAWFMAHLRSKGLRVEEASLRAEDLSEASEIILTNAIRGLMPVKAVAGTRFTASQNPICNQAAKQLLI